nr:hypothetical protein [Tanacetum cinerariifolium]
MGDKIAQTRFENVSKLSNESLLVRDNTLRCDEDSMKLNELMELCTTLQSRILALEKTKTTQALEITRLKMRVKKLEKKQRSRTHKLKRLYKNSLMMILILLFHPFVLFVSSNHIIPNINDQDDDEIFDVDNLHGKEVFVDKDDADKEVNVAGELNASSIATTDSVAVTITTEEVNLAKALTELKALKPKVKGVFIQQPSESITTTTAISSKKSQDKGKVKRDKEKRNKPPTQAQQRKIMCIYLKNMEGKKLKDLKNKYFDSIQKMFDKAFNRQKVDDDKETTELKKLMEIIPNEEEVAIDAIPLAVKSLKIVDWKIHKEEKKSYYQILRADENSKMYTVFNIILKEFDREDLEDLYRLVKAKYGSTRPVEDLDLILWGNLKTMFEPHVEDEVWKMQQRYNVVRWTLYESCRVHCLSLQSGYIYMRIVTIKSHLNVVGITTAHIDVNTTLMKLVLLYKEVTTAQDEVCAAQELQEIY